MNSLFRALVMLASLSLASGNFFRGLLTPRKLKFDSELEGAVVRLLDGHNHDGHDHDGEGDSGNSAGDSMNQMGAFGAISDPLKSLGENPDKQISGLSAWSLAAAEFAEANPDGTRCNVGGSIELGGTFNSFLEELSTIMRGIPGEGDAPGDNPMGKLPTGPQTFLPTLMVPCGSPLDASEYMVAGFEQVFGVNSKKWACTGMDCKCASMSIKMNMLFQMNINEFLAKQKAEMTPEEKKEIPPGMSLPGNLEELKALLNNPAMADQVAKFGKAQMDGVIKMLDSLSKGFDMETHLKMNLCVSKDLSEETHTLKLKDANQLVPLPEDAGAEGMKVTFHLGGKATVTGASKSSAVKEPVKDERVFVYEGVEGKAGSLTPAVVVSIGDDGSVTVKDEAGETKTISKYAITTEAEKELGEKIPDVEIEKPGEQEKNGANTQAALGTATFLTSAVLVFSRVL